MNFQVLKRKLKELNHARIRGLRTLRRQILKGLLDQRPVVDERLVKSETFFHSNAEIKIVILRTDGKLGDSVTATYLIDLLKTHFPQSQITIISDPVFHDLFAPLVFHFIGLKSRFIPVMKWLLGASKKYDVLISTSHILSPSAILLCRFIPAVVKISLLNFDWKLFTHHVQFNENDDHVTVRYQNIVKCFISNADQGTMRLPPPKYSIGGLGRDEAVVSSYVAELKSKFRANRLCVVNSFAGARLRNFSKETTQALITQLLAEFPDMVVVSIGNSGDQNILQDWKKSTNVDSQQVDTVRWVIAPFSSLNENVSLLNQADLVVTPDTSIVHLTCALQKPLVAVYREDVTLEKNQKIWGPIGHHFQIIESTWVQSGSNENGDINHVAIPEIIKAARRLLRQA